MRTSARRLSGGGPLREAMLAAGMKYQALADRTAEIDPDGDLGVSVQLVAFLATRKRWARETTTWGTANLIEDALQVPRGSLFERLEIAEKRDALAWVDL